MKTVAIPEALGQIQEPTNPLSIDLNLLPQKMDDPKSYWLNPLVHQYVQMALLVGLG